MQLVKTFSSAEETVACVVCSLFASLFLSTQIVIVSAARVLLQLSELTLQLLWGEADFILI
jgi:hypothetical protein